MDKTLQRPVTVGTVKETIYQVSHSKKWASEMALDENGLAIRDANGRAVLVNAYSLLPEIQEFFESEEGQREFSQWKAKQKEEHKS